MPVRAFPIGGRHWAGGAFYSLWVMLLEKAFPGSELFVTSLARLGRRDWTTPSSKWVVGSQRLAKLCGSYEALRESHHGTLLMALTGGWIGRDASIQQDQC